jgi:hypothetical protein
VRGCALLLDVADHGYERVGGRQCRARGPYRAECNGATGGRGGGGYWDSAVALLATTHILAILSRFNPAPPPDLATELQDRALELAMDKMGRWEAAGAELQARLLRE